MKKLLICLLLVCSCAFGQTDYYSPYDPGAARSDLSNVSGATDLTLSGKVRAAWADIRGDIYASGSATIAGDADIGGDLTGVNASFTEVVEVDSINLGDSAILKQKSTLTVPAVATVDLVSVNLPASRRVAHVVIEGFAGRNDGTSGVEQVFKQVFLLSRAASGASTVISSPAGANYLENTTTLSGANDAALTFTTNILGGATETQTVTIRAQNGSTGGVSIWYRVSAMTYGANVAVSIP